jgi:tRNA (guanine-N7-)-methyltransferase
MAVFPGKKSISPTSCGAFSDPALDRSPSHPARLYGRKRGRPLRPGQRVLLDALLPRLAIRLPQTGRVDPVCWFAPPPQKVWLEIGFGGGEHLAALAEAHPDIGFIGSEVFENGVAKLLARIERRHLANVRLYTEDARRLIAVLAPASVDRVFILFPDPWPKARHLKRRLVSAETIDALARIIPAGGELRLATDHRDYFAWMLERVTSHPGFAWLARRPSDWRARPADCFPTRYEEKAVAAGRSPLFLRARRV